jgi:hypothetical protein
MTATPWARVTLPNDPTNGDLLDASLLFSATGTGYPSDILAENLPNIVWLHTNDQGPTWTPRVVAQMPKTSHINGRSVLLDRIRRRAFRLWLRAAVLRYAK